MSLVECWYHYFWDRQACNNSAAYLFLPQIGSILTSSGFGAGCHPPRAVEDDQKFREISLSLTTRDRWWEPEQTLESLEPKQRKNQAHKIG